jgi:hypothetical protein
VSSRSGLFMYGYRVGEVPLPQLPAPKATARLRTLRKADKDKRPVVQASLGVHVPGAALPHADPQCELTMLAGVSKRFALDPPKPDPGLLCELRGFVRSWVKQNLTPLSPDADCSVASWLNASSYPLWRKTQLQETWDNVSSIYENPKWFECKSFMKDETYVAFKHARGINSRSDQFKCAVGPIFRLIEKEVFKHPAFIKKIPVNERPQYIMDRLYAEGGIYAASDYTAFESLFTKEIMEAVEFELYQYMTQYLPEGGHFMKLVREVLGGKNVCRYKNFSVELEATRMSGEMCTSLGNGFSNLMFLLFTCHRIGSECIPVVEGDDSLSRIIGPLPTTEHFSAIGLNIKLEIHTALNEASFCGLIFDEEDKTNVTDIREVMASFGWTTRQYAGSKDSKKKALLRCKALSLAYQYPGCPVLSSLAKYALRVTRGADVRHLAANIRNTYEREQMLEAVRHKVMLVPVGIRTRLLVERLYNISVETQLILEKWLDGLNEIQPLNHPLILDHMDPCWKAYYNEYGCVTCSPFPCLTWGPKRGLEVDIPLLLAAQLSATE